MQAGNLLSSSSLFGQQQQPTTSSLFGQQQPSSNSAMSLFGQQQPQSQLLQSTAGPGQNPFNQSLLGQNQQQPNFGASTLGQQQQLMQPQPQFSGYTVDPAHAAVANPAIASQIARIQAAWDRSSTACEFQYYFYNRVPREEAALYVKPPNHDQRRWDEAIANRPDDSVVPVLAVGFEDVARRTATQKQQVFAYRMRMHEIANKLSELANKTDLSTTTKIQEAQIKHLDLYRRTLNLAIRLQTLRMRGYALNAEEELLRVRLDKLDAQLKDPATFGRKHEMWARMVYVREQNRKIEQCTISTMESPLTQNPQQLALFLKALKEQQKTIAYVTNVLLDDEKAIQQITKDIDNKELRERSATVGTPGK